MTTGSEQGLSWRTSSYSGGNGDCVEVAGLTAGTAVRDSKHPDSGCVDLSRQAWHGLLTHLGRHAR